MKVFGFLCREGYIKHDGKVCKVEIKHYSLDLKSGDVYIHGTIAEEGVKNGKPWVEKAFSDECPCFRIYESATGCATGKNSVDWVSHVDECIVHIENYSQRHFSKYDIMWCYYDGKISSIELYNRGANLDMMKFEYECIGEYDCFGGKFTGGVADKVDMFYETEEECLMFHEITKVEMDGTTSKIGGKAKNFILTAEQKKILEQLDSLLNKADELGIKFLFDMSRDEVYAFTDNDTGGYKVYGGDLGKGTKYINLFSKDYGATRGVNFRSIRSMEDDPDGIFVPIE